MWKIFHAIRNFFKAINNFLTVCEDYIELRLLTGKAKGDVKIVTKRLKENTHERASSNSKKIYNSLTVQQFLFIVKRRWAILMRIALLENIANFIFDVFFLLKNFSVELFLNVTLTLLLFLILLNLFENYPIGFFIAFFPIMTINALFLSIIYYRIDRYIKGQKLSLLNNFQETLQHSSSVIYVILLHLFIILHIILLFPMLALFLSYIFDLIKVTWANSFMYWFLLVSSFFLITVIIFVFGIVANQAYYFALLQQKNPIQAFKAGWSLLDKYSFSFFSYYVLLYFFLILFIYWATINYFHTGLVAATVLLINGTIFLGFILRKMFINKYPIPDEPSHTKQPLLFTMIIYLGFFAYMLIALLGIKEYPNIIGFIERSQENLITKKQLTKTYTDKKFGYSLMYPKSWDLYGWHDDSITFYNNYTGTINGGIWLNITVSPFSQETFDNLYHSRPGLFSYDTQTGDVTTKISNINVNGYNGVNYIFTKANPPYPQFQIHYLIHRDKRAYDIVFVTMNKDVEERNSSIFKDIINSFKFTR
jgi:hypothetical protein